MLNQVNFFDELRGIGGEEKCFGCVWGFMSGNDCWLSRRHEDG
jgi:hypothetical protein